MKKTNIMDFIKNIEKGTYDIEMIVDGSIFEEDTVLRAAYELVDKVYMFFKKDGDDILVQFKLKEEGDLDNIVNSFGEELVYHRLRKQIDEKTGDLRKKVVETALGFGLSLDEVKSDIDELGDKIPNHGNDNNLESSEEQSKSVDEIIKEIENDPDFEEDKDEIVDILKEIEEEDSSKEKK